MHPALKAMLTETIGHAAYTGMDQYGKPTYGPVIQRPARIQYKVTVIANAQGQQRTSTTTAYTDGDFVVNVRDQIFLPDSTAPAIQEIYSPRDPWVVGIIDHHEIML